jgi:hypothetical protein
VHGSPMSRHSPDPSGAGRLQEERAALALEAERLRGHGLEELGLDQLEGLEGELKDALARVRGWGRRAGGRGARSASSGRMRVRGGD